MPLPAPAVIFSRPGKVDVTTVEVPEPEHGEVLVRTVYSGVSQGTERWLLTGRYNHAGEDPAANYPCFPGYQAAGLVEQVGAGVTGMNVGDPVMLSGTRFADPAVRNPGPGLAAHVALLTARADAVTRLAPEVDLAEAALFRMAGVARHGARLAGIQAGDLVAVIGLGMIGQMAAQAARRRGARVIAADLIARRVSAAAAHSADVAIDASTGSLHEAVRRESPDGADVVVDTTGSSGILTTCLDLVRHEGRICLQGYYPDPIPIDFHPTHLKRVTVTFPCGWDGPDADRGIADDLAARRLAIAPLITHRVPFAEAPSAYALVVDHPEQSLGMVLDWRDAR